MCSANKKLPKLTRKFFVGHAVQNRQLMLQGDEKNKI